MQFIRDDFDRADYHARRRGIRLTDDVNARIQHRRMAAHFGVQHPEGVHLALGLDKQARRRGVMQVILEELYQGDLHVYTSRHPTPSTT